VYASGLNESHHGANMNNWFMDEGLPQYFDIVDRLSTMISVRHDVSKEIECRILPNWRKYSFFLCRLLTWHYQEDEECLRIVAKEDEQQQEEEETRLRIGAEETEAAWSQQQQQREFLWVEVEVEATRLKREEEQRLRIETEEAEAARLQQQQTRGSVSSYWRWSSGSC